MRASMSLSRFEKGSATVESRYRISGRLKWPLAPPRQCCLLRRDSASGRQIDKRITAPAHASHFPHFLGALLFISSRSAAACRSPSMSDEHLPGGWGGRGGRGERGATAGRLSLARGSRCERKGANERHSCRPLECFGRSEDGMRRGSCRGAHVCREGRRCGGLLLGAPPSLTLVVGAALYRLPLISFPSDWTRWPASCCLSRLARMTPNEINGRVMAHWRRALEFTGSRGSFLSSDATVSLSPERQVSWRRGQQALSIMHPRPLFVLPGTGPAHSCLLPRVVDQRCSPRSPGYQCFYARR